MHGFLRSLVRHRSNDAFRYGATLLLFGAISAARYVLPLDTAPFLLYMPALFLVGVGFGRTPAVIGLAISTGFAIYFFYRSPPYGELSVSQVVAVVQYAILCFAMVLLCDALRSLLAQNESAIAAMGELNATLAAARDDAEAARAVAEASKDAAESANRAKSAFLANMSHELRTPLSAVIGYTEMLEEDLADLGRHAALGDLGRVKANATHLLGLINDVLDLSKVEADRMDVSPEESDAASFVRDAAAAVGPLVRRRGNALTLDLPGDLGLLFTDVVKLRQCLFNLLSNAAKFMENGRIALRARREARDGADWLILAVEDTGIGMTPEQVERLFQRFTQADESTTRRFGGTGLGLALSRALAQLLGGDIGVESALGQGTTFTLRVPAALPGRGAPERRAA